eukprot:9983584-Alexandrium_andersonii.AAC.1
MRAQIEQSSEVLPKLEEIRRPAPCWSRRLLGTTEGPRAWLDRRGLSGDTAEAREGWQARG